VPEIDLIIFTDIWRVNGSFKSELLVRLLDEAYLRKKKVRLFSSRDCPVSFYPGRYSEKRIGLFSFARTFRILKRNKFNSIYVATPNGPVGFTAIVACWILRLDYSTSKRLCYPKYLKDLIHLAKHERSEDAASNAASNILSMVMR